MKAGACQCGTYPDWVLSCVLIGNLRCAEKICTASWIWDLCPYIAVEKKWNRLGPLVGRHCWFFLKWGQAVSCSQRCDGSVSHRLWNGCLMLMSFLIVVWPLSVWEMLYSMVCPACWWKLFMSSENWDMAGSYLG